MSAKMRKLIQLSMAEFKSSWFLILGAVLGASLILGVAHAQYLPPDGNHTGGVYQGTVYEDPCTLGLRAFAKDYYAPNGTTSIRLLERGTQNVIIEAKAPNPDPLLIAINFPTTDHGTVMTIPAAWRDGVTHYFDIYVNDIASGDWYGPFDPHIYDTFVNPSGYYFYDNFKCGSPPVVYNYVPHLTPVSAGPFPQGAVGTISVTYFTSNTSGGPGNGPTYNLGLEEVSGPTPPTPGVLQTRGPFPTLPPGISTPPGLRPTYPLDISGYTLPGTYCFKSTVTPSDTGVKAYSTEQLCFTINAVTQPFLRTTGSDVHAGGCDLPSSGTIKTNSGLLGDQIISSAGSITNPGGTYTSIPAYGSICRPDLVSAAQAVGSPPGTNGVAGAISNQVYTLTNFSGGRYILGGDNTNFVTTIYADGNLQIKGNIIVGPTGALGIIANGDVYIDPAVTNLSNVYIFAKGTIYTCGDNTTDFTNKPTVTACRQPLNLSGLMSGGGFVFGRTGGDTASGIASEDFKFQPAVYLLAPPLFGGSYGKGLLNTFTEKPPLY